MHGAIYLATSKITYVAINHINFFAYRIAYKTTAALSGKISVKPELKHLNTCSKQESSFSSCVESGRRLVSSWMGSLEDNLIFIRGMPLTYTNIYLSHHMANAAALTLLKMQPIAYRAAIKVVCSSAILTIFSGSVINFCYKRSYRTNES